MTFAEALRALPLADGTIAALVVDRVSPITASQRTAVPAITYEVLEITGGRVFAMTGPVGLVKKSVRYISWAATYLGAEALDAALRQALDGYRGAVGSPALVIQGIFADGPGRDGYEPSADEATGSGAGLYTWTRTFTVWHEETP